MDLEILYPQDDLKEWDKFNMFSPQGSVFCKSWWLNTVCDDNFQIFLVKENRELLGGMALPIQKKGFLKYSIMPKFTQTLGPLLIPLTQLKTESRISKEIKIMDFLVQNIPDLFHISINCHYYFTNWLPFYWAGYQQTTKYTYVLENLQNLDEILNGFSHGYRNTIKKATENGIFVIESRDIDEFIRLNELTFLRKGLKLPYSKVLVREMILKSFQQESGKLFFAIDKNGDAHAAIFVIYDQRRMYNLMQSINPTFSSSGANILLMWEVIQFASKNCITFDFEGSMIKEIELVFRRFGAEQKQYFNIRKTYGFNETRKLFSSLKLSRLLR